MTDVNYLITLDLHRTGTQATVNAKSGDAASRRIRVRLTERGREWRIPDGAIAVFYAEKPDGTVIFNSCELEDGTAVVILTSQTLAVPGDVNAELRISDAEGVIGTPGFRITVEPSLCDDSAVESTNEFTALTAAIEAASAVALAASNGEFDGAPGAPGAPGADGQDGQDGQDGEQGSGMIGANTVSSYETFISDGSLGHYMTIVWTGEDGADIPYTDRYGENRYVRVNKGDVHRFSYNAVGNVLACSYIGNIAGPAGEDGADGIEGQPGTNGTDGADGYSPTVTVETITGGHEVTVTDINGEHVFDVMDGAGGGGGVTVVDLDQTSLGNFEGALQTFIAAAAQTPGMNARAVWSTGGLSASDISDIFDAYDGGMLPVLGADVGTQQTILLPYEFDFVTPGPALRVCAAFSFEYTVGSDVFRGRADVRMTASDIEISGYVNAGTATYATQSYVDAAIGSAIGGAH